MDLVCSFILRYENAENPDSLSRDSIAQFFTKASLYVGSDEIKDVQKSAAELIKQGIKMKDALHLACAINARCDYFITTDDKLIKKYTGTKIKIRTPITFLDDLEE
ncbi:MAG: hypothetical protein Pg6A_11720 [Termitinemataceae bacterium]|nr:MAG: hypothetical protein Pg6A_11720 [Termitinemataceae bacterium]